MSPSAPIPIEVRLLSEPGLRVGGRPVEARTSRVLALLGYLASRGNRAVPRTEIAEALWPDREAATAHHNLRQTLLYLRQSLGERADASLIATRRDLRLRPEAVETDVGKFRSLLASDRLNEAIGLYGGPFLEGLDDNWILPVRAEMTQAFVGALLKLSDLARQDSPAQALAYAERAVAEEPFHDGARARKILALRAMGEETRALREYEAYETLLADELGLRPAPIVEGALSSPLRAEETDPAPSVSAGLGDVFAVLDAGERAVDALRLVIAMAGYWSEVGQASEGLRQLEARQGAASDDAALRSEATLTIASLALRTGDVQRAMREAQSVVESSSDARERARAMVIASHGHLRRRETYEARKAALCALRVLRRRGPKAIENEAWWSVSTAHRFEGRISRAAMAARRGLASAGDSVRARVRAGILLANAQTEPGLESEARATLEGVIGTVADDRTPFAAGVRSTAARLYEEAGEVAKAEAGYVATIEEYRRYEDPWGLAVALTYLGDLRSAKGEDRDAVPLHREALAIRERMEDEIGRATSLRGLGRAYFALEEYEAAREALREAARLYATGEALPGVASCLIPLARAEIALGSPEVAQRLAERAVHLLRGMSPAVRATIGPRSERLLPEAEALAGGTSL